MNSNNTRNRDAVVRDELAWHEQKAHRRYFLDGLLYDPPAFDAVVHPAFEFLKGNKGELLLDIGCGEGKHTLELAINGLCVIATDLSSTQLIRTVNTGERVVTIKRSKRACSLCTSKC